MPEFHETGYGRRFFDAQLPALIKALEALAPKPPTWSDLDTAGRVSRLITHLDKIDERIVALEERSTERYNELLAHQSGMDEQLETLEKKVAALTTQLSKSQ